MTGAGLSTPFVLAVGDPLVAFVPTRPVGLDVSDELTAFVGGAELNTAVGVRRLGVGSAWLGRVGADPLGLRVVRTLDEEGVDTSLVVVDPRAPTGVYLREWLADGRRRPYYYRHEGAGAQLRATDWPQQWPAALPVPSALHLTGITAALSQTAQHALHAMIDRASASGCLVSVDPNFRASLWPDAEQARRVLGALARRADLLLVSEEDARTLFDTADPAAVIDRAAAWGIEHVVVKLGSRGAVVRHGADVVEVAPARAVAVLDPVGAGDGFDAGYLAATLTGLPTVVAGRCGAWCGARAVEQLGENSGYPRRAELPADLRAAFDAAPRQPSGHDR